MIHNKDKHWPTPLDMSQHTGHPKYLLTMPPSSSLALRYVGGQPLQTIESMEHRTSLQLTAVFTAVKITSSMIQTQNWSWKGEGAFSGLCIHLSLMSYTQHGIFPEVTPTIVVPLLKRGT